MESENNTSGCVTPENVTIKEVKSDEVTDRMETVVSDWLWKVVPPFILCIGLIGNFLTICVIRRLGLKRKPTLVFICSLAVTDSVVLLSGLPRHWILYTFGYDLRTASNANCKLYYFFIYFSMQFSAWILVGVAFERVIKIHFPLQYKGVFTVKKVVVGLCTTAVVLVLVNIHFFFTNGINEYTEGSCSSLTPDFFYFDEHIFVYIDFSILSVVPTIIMTVCTILITTDLKKVKERRSTMMHASMSAKANRVSVKMTKMLVVCTFYFLVATVPISVYFILDTYLTPGYEADGDEKAVAAMDLVWTTTYLLQFSNYSINFYLYTAMNERFWKEFKMVIRCKHSPKRGMKIYTVQNSQKISSSRSHLTESSFNDSTHSTGLEQSRHEKTECKSTYKVISATLPTEMA